MSDALCGPSNALQNFQKHATADRTLQQDRLVSRQSPSQGFRSQNASEGILDPEFAAFESNSSPGVPLSDVQYGGHFIPPAPHMSMSHPAEAPNWANEFQNLHISGPPQNIHHQPGPAAARTSTSPQQAWHGEFLRQHQQHTPVLQQKQAFNQRFQPSFAPSYALNNSSMGNETTANTSSEAETFDESAFEAAFEQAKVDMVSQFESSVLETNASEMSLNNKHQTEEASVQPSAQETIRIGSDTIPQLNKNNPQAATNDADELARTAGQLLNSVSHETDHKFRGSNFLALMRRIRDREVQVEGDEFRETAQSLHPGGDYYPEGKRGQEFQQKRSWRPIGQSDYVHVASSENNTDSEHLTSHVTNAAPDALNTEATGSSGPAEKDSIYAGWNHGDRWA
ncbi:hypothetical protein BDW62DRAFT_174924 [Aspergillus aurantiobrunneus]